MRSDSQLLKEYVETRCEDAFAQLVRRHLDLVYSAALRQVRSLSLAEEIAQTVFIELAGNAHRLAHDTVVTAWLYQVTRWTAIDVIRRETRRQVRDQIAAEMNATNDSVSDWQHIEPLLDEAMDALGPTDRTAVLLRFFENKSLREVGQALGMSDDAAQKRVSRAVDRLRAFFAKRRVSVGASSLVALLSSNAIHAAPSGLNIAISSAATAAAVTSMSGAAVAITTQTIIMTTAQKLTLAAFLTTAVGIGILEVRHGSKLRAEVRALEEEKLSLHGQVERLGDEQANAMRQMAVLQQENANLRESLGEVHRLRAEVARLLQNSQERSQGNEADHNDPIESAAKTWVERVAQMKERLAQFPEAGIPELELLTPGDWLGAAKYKLENELDYRRALSTLRATAENKFANTLRNALEEFSKSGKGEFPKELSQLQPYFEERIDPAILDRWEIVPASKVPNVRMGGDSIVTQKSPIDEVFDQCLVIGPNGHGSTDFLSRSTTTILNPVRQAYRAANDGKWPSRQSDLLPYATTREQEIAIRKWVERSAVSK